VTVRPADGSDTVASATDTEDTFSTNCEGLGSGVRWEHPLSVYYDNDPTATWPPGEYVAELRVDDFYSGKTGVVTVEFTVRDPSS
jgi:hypothetical protein